MSEDRFLKKSEEFSKSSINTKTKVFLIKFGYEKELKTFLRFALEFA